LQKVTTYTDGELVQLLQQGERWAYDAIYEKWWKACINAAHARLKLREESEDIVQNIFIRLWIKRNSLAILDLKGYLMAAVHFEVVKFLTRHKENLHFERPFEEMLAETHSPDEHLREKNLLELLIAYSSTLTPSRRQILLLFIQDKLTTREIADTLDISQKTVQNQLRTAILELQEKLPKALILLLLTKI
jgi:RNA polymerase sigma factor (sigma-70 family)